MQEKEKMLINDCNILGDPVSIDSIHYIHRPWVISRLLLVLTYEALWLVISVFSFSVRKSNCIHITHNYYAFISVFMSTTAKFDLFLSTICRNSYFNLIYNQSNRLFQIKRGDSLSSITPLNVTNIQRHPEEF